MIPRPFLQRKPQAWTENPDIVNRTAFENAAKPIQLFTSDNEWHGGPLIRDRYVISKMILGWSDTKSLRQIPSTQIETDHRDEKDERAYGESHGFLTIIGWRVGIGAASEVACISEIDTWATVSHLRATTRSTAIRSPVVKRLLIFIGLLKTIEA